MSKNTEVLKYFDINKKSIILIAISFFAIQKLFFIFQYSINFPYSVDHIVFGYFIDYLVDGGSFTHYLFSTHSEHYLIFPRLIMLPNLILNNFNFINSFYIQWIVLSATMAVIYFLVNKTNRSISWILIPISAFIYSPLINSEMALWYNQWYLPALGFILVIYFLDSKKLNFKSFGVASSAGFLATFSCIIGIVGWIPAIFLLLRNYFTEQNLSNIGWIILWIPCIVLVGITFYFFNNISESENGISVLFTSQGVNFILTFISAAFRLQFHSLMILTGILSIIFSTFCIYYFIFIEKKIKKVIPWISFLLIGIISAAVTALGRAHYIDHLGNEPYYIPISQFFQIGLIVLAALMIFEIKKRQKSNSKTIILIILYLIIFSHMLLLVPSYYSGWVRGEHYLQEKLILIECLSLKYDKDCMNFYEHMLDPDSPLEYNYLFENNLSIFSEKDFSLSQNELEDYELIKNNLTSFVGNGQIESINNIPLEGETSITIDDDVIILKGWAIDSEKEELDNLFLLVNDLPLSKSEEFDLRTDLTDNFDIDKSKKLGWTFSFLSGYLDDGCSSLSLVSSKNQNLIKFSDTLQICK